MAEKKFLIREQQELFDEVMRFVSHVTPRTVEMTAKQYKIWNIIERKARDASNFDYANKIYEAKKRGFVFCSRIERKRNSSKNLESFDF